MFVVTKATAAPPSSRSAVRDRADASAAVPEESSDAAVSTEPTLTWFDDRRYYVGRALPFFSSVSSIGGSVVQKRNSPWYPAVEAVAQSSPNLRVIHASLLPLATPEGGLLLSAFVNKFLVTLVPPHSDLSYVRTWYRRVGVPVAVEPAGGSGAPKVEARAGSPVPNAKGTPLSTRNTKAPPAVTAVSFDDEAVDLVLPYLDVLRAIDVLFNRSNGQATKWAFALCDLGETGFILKGTMQHLSTRDAALDTFAISEPVLNHRVVPEPKKPVGLGPTRVATTLTVEPSPDLTYTIVRAILQCFEHIAAKEVEVATAALGKKGKKGKKGAAPVLPSKRQFHINMQEFSSIMAIDPYVTSAFLPFIMKCAVNEEQPNATRPSATAVAAPSPAPSDTTTSRRPPTTAPSDEGTTSAAPSRLGAATPAGVAALHTSPPIVATPQPAQPEAPPVPEY